VVEVAETLTTLVAVVVTAQVVVVGLVLAQAVAVEQVTKM
jgi:hypothetical protein